MKEKDVRMTEHNTFAMVIDPLLCAWVSVYDFQCQIIVIFLTLPPVVPFYCSVI